MRHDLIPKLRRALPAAAFVLALQGVSLSGPPEPPHRDVQLSVEGGQIVTGVIDFDAPGTPVVPGVRVFPGAFGEAPNGTDDPGFNATGNTSANPQPFAPNTLIGFDILDALREWDGSDFDSIPAETMTVSLGNNSRTTPPAAGQSVTGFNFAVAGSTGGFHQHMNLFLNAPFSQGVYLLTLRLRASAGPAPSAPFYFVMRQGDSAALVQAQLDAISYVQDVLLAPPCAGDANGDGAVNFADVTSVLANFGGAGPAGDANHDEAVNFADVTAVLANFGSGCP